MIGVVVVIVTTYRPENVERMVPSDFISHCCATSSLQGTARIYIMREVRGEMKGGGVLHILYIFCNGVVLRICESVQILFLSAYGMYVIYNTSAGGPGGLTGATTRDTRFPCTPKMTVVNKRESLREGEEEVDKRIYIRCRNFILTYVFAYAYIYIRKTDDGIVVYINQNIPNLSWFTAITSLYIFHHVSLSQ